MEEYSFMIGLEANSFLPFLFHLTEYYGITSTEITMMFAKRSEPYTLLRDLVFDNFLSIP